MVQSQSGLEGVSEATEVTTVIDIMEIERATATTGNLGIDIEMDTVTPAQSDYLMKTDPYP